MPTNREYLDQLASESPDKLKAWFDAEHNDNLAAEKVVSGDAANSNDGNAHLKAHSKTEPLLTERSELLSDEADTREYVKRRTNALQQQVDELTDSYEASSRANEILTLENGQVKTENAKLQAQVDELMQKLDNLAHDLAESERFREELREQLSVAYDHAHDLLARRDRGLA